MKAYWLIVRVLLTPPAEAAASQKWKIIYLQVLKTILPASEHIGRVETFNKVRRKFSRVGTAKTLLVRETIP